MHRQRCQKHIKNTLCMLLKDSPNVDTARSLAFDGTDSTHDDAVADDPNVPEDLTASATATRRT